MWSISALDVWNRTPPLNKYVLTSLQIFIIIIVPCVFATIWHTGFFISLLNCLVSYCIQLKIYKFMPSYTTVISNTAETCCTAIDKPDHGPDNLLNFTLDWWSYHYMFASDLYHRREESREWWFCSYFSYKATLVQWNMGRQGSGDGFKVIRLDGWFTLQQQQL
jgi:hypothetical protein